MTFIPDDFVVWTEIPVTDLDRATTFYNSVFKTTLKREDMGPNPIAIFPTAGTNSVAGHLYPGKPAPAGTGPTLHFACPDALEDTMDRFANAGGTVLSDPITIPPGRFAYCQDPDGNSIGLFESAKMAKTVEHETMDQMQDA